MARTATKSAAAPAQQTTSRSDSNGSNTGPAKPPPAHTIRYRNVRASIWLNDGAKGKFYSVTFSRSYQDNDNVWHDVYSFTSNDLPLLAKISNDCHSWIAWQTKRAADEAERAKSARA